ncbi:MAG: class I SAM-dependent methyltransferase [Proteobacteria bacterium]|nr:class I SAM-dependent methyltransferase [Pseudomonadota bacterium]
MRPKTLDLLACPACRAESSFTMTAARVDDDGDVIDGTLECRHCPATFPISSRVPRFVDADDDYCGNFGYQWDRWRSIQVDRLAGHQLSETRFLNDSRWDRSWLKGKLILDAGCGAGRFTDVAASLGARVISCDLSGAIDSCRETTAVHGAGVECLQASLFDLPLRPGIFDGVFCMGVIQHTPDPARVIRTLPDLVKPGGRLAYNFYEEGLWRRLQIVKYFLRLFTPRLSPEAILRLSKGLVSVFFPLTRALSQIRKIRIINHFIPIAASHDPALDRNQQYEWTLLDTFDWYSPVYEKCQRYRDVATMVEDAGMIDIEASPGLVRATRPRA